MGLSLLNPYEYDYGFILTVVLKIDRNPYAVTFTFFPSKNQNIPKLYFVKNPEYYCVLI